VNRSVVEAVPLGDSAITIKFGHERSPELLERIHSAARSLVAARVPHVEDVVPAYLALTIFYDPLRATYQEMARQLVSFCENAGDSSMPNVAPREHVIPVKYEGIDLSSVAAATGLTVEDVVRLHTGRTYSVDLLGFVPGYAYMSELDPVLQIPRRPQPRPRVAAGSVAIAAAQTGIYPLDTPGGWHILGTTTTVMFDPAREPPSLLAAGDTVRFQRVG
jgi:KipI family sensor histidine kinase inhibitor